MGAQTTTQSFVQLQTMKFANSPTVEMPGFSRNPVLCSIFHLKRTASAGADGPSPCCCAPRFRVDRPRRCLFRSCLKTPREEPLQTNQIHQLLENDGPRCEINPFNPSLAARNPSEGCGRQNVTLKSKKLLWKWRRATSKSTAKQFASHLKYFPSKRQTSEVARWVSVVKKVSRGEMMRKTGLHVKQLSNRERTDKPVY